MLDQTIPIFDVDTHYAEPPDLWTSRAPQKYVGQVLKIERKPDDREAWFLGSREIGMPGPSVIDRNMRKHLGIYTLPTYDLMADAASQGPARLSYMDSVGIGSQIIYPNIIGFGAQALMEISSDEELRLWHVRAYNDAIADLQRESHDRLLPQAALPLWNMDATLAELARIRKLGLTGVAMSHSPGDFGQPPLTSPTWERFFATCQDLKLPINFHIGSGSWVGELSKWWGDDQTMIYPDGSLNEPLAAFAGTHLFLDQFHDLANLIMTGLLEKFPKLNFVLVESGCGWIPFAIQGLEHQWREMVVSERFRKHFKRQPREMFLDQIYTSYWFEGRNCIDSFIAEFGSRNLMFETDFPHPTSLYPHVREAAEATLGHHGVDVQRAVLHGNAERIYGVDVKQPVRA